METQWPLVIFTLFVCITCGLLGSMSILAAQAWPLSVAAATFK